MATIEINDISYSIIEIKEKMTVADSFVVTSNKIGSAHGEAKFYIGNDGSETRDFFGSREFRLNCFLLKKDLVKYLEDCKSEYTNPDQNYRDRDNLPRLWQERMTKVLQLGDIIYFTLEEQIQIEGPRVYVKSDDVAYKLIRELSLPNITYLSAMKLEQRGRSVFYFKLFVDYFGENQNSSEIAVKVKEIENYPVSITQRTQLIQARIGQGKYRKALLEECPFCPITLVSDDRLLIAGHIKPWIDSNDREKLDSKNGFMFTPTFDLLFGKGFISFTNDKKILISPWLSKLTCSRLNISSNKRYLALPTEEREIYLEYHRTNIYKS